MMCCPMSLNRIPEFFKGEAESSIFMDIVLYKFKLLLNY